MHGSGFRIVFKILAGEFESKERFPGFVLLLEENFGKNSLNEMNAAISREKMVSSGRNKK